MDTKKMRACAPLLPAPGDEVVCECLDEIDRLQTMSSEVLDFLAMMFDAYEESPDCYEDPEDCSGHIGKAIHLDDEAFQRIADILNTHRPRVTPNVKWPSYLMQNIASNRMAK